MLARKKQQGLGLIEILIALVVATLLLGGVGNAYIGSRETYALNDNMARIQESARFAIDTMSREVRQAGGSLCMFSGETAINTLNTTTDWVGISVGIKGYDGSAANFPAQGFPAVGNSPGDRVAGSDAFIATRGSGDGFSITGHNPNSAQFRLNKDHDFSPGDIMVICDGTNSGIFQVTNANTSNVTIVHNTGNKVSPGNCTKTIKGQGDCQDLSNGTLVESAEGYTDGSQVIKFSSVGYYIGVGQTGQGNSLYRVQLNPSSSGLSFSAQEIVPFVETMQIQYGIDGDGNGAVDSYVKASDINSSATLEWNRVITSKVGLLLRSPEEVVDVADSTFYTVAGEKVGPTGTITHSGGNRLRFVVSSVIKLRNRGQSI